MCMYLYVRNQPLRETVHITYLPVELDSARQLSSIESSNTFQCLPHHHLSLHFFLMKLLYIDISLSWFSTIANYITFKMHYTDAYRFYYYLHVNDTTDLKTCQTLRPISARHVPEIVKHREAHI